MSKFFADAMRRAVVSTRAFDVAEATRIIKQALAGDVAGADVEKTTLRQTAPSAKRREPLRQPNAEIIEPGDQAPPPAPDHAVHEARLRKPLGEVLRALREVNVPGKLSDAVPGLRTSHGQSAPPVPDGAAFVSRSYACAAGRRTYKLYTPASAPTKPNGLLVMLHGCKQTPDDFAAGSAMNDIAEKHGLLVAYPCQTAAANASSCWNWFNPSDQTRDRGEPTIIAGMTRELTEEFAIPRDRTFVAGLSAGGAMAAIMGETHPDLYAGVGIHSGLAYGSANDVMSALATMRGAMAKQPFVPRKATGQPVRTIVFQGSADRVVHPSNADRIFAHVSPANAFGGATEKKLVVNGRSCTRTTITDPDGSRRVESWTIDGAGHAWSGGKPAGSFTDASGPDASLEMVRFFLDIR